MIDRHERRIAAAIAKGCPVPHNSLPKTAAYGHTAPLLGSVSLAAVQQELAKGDGTSVDELMSELSKALGDPSFAALRQSPRRSELNDLYNALRSDRGMAETGAAALGAIDHGLRVGVRAIGLGLRTLRYEARRGNFVTHDGLVASGEVPYRLSMQLGGMSPDGSDDHGLTEVPDPPIADNELGAVLKSTVYTIDPIDGLRLAIRPHFYSDGPRDPHLGCPMTFVDEYIPTLHTITANEAVSRGIIPLAD